MKDYMRFQERAVKQFVDIVSYLADLWKRQKDPVITDTLWFAMARVLNAFSLLDNMKNSKTAWNNDFAMYKRCACFFSFLRYILSSLLLIVCSNSACANLKKANDDEAMDNQMLYLFLANHDSITTKLRQAVMAIEGSVDVLTAVVNTCVDFYEAERYVLPMEKYSCIRVRVPFTFFV